MFALMYCVCNLYKLIYIFFVCIYTIVYIYLYIYILYVGIMVSTVYDILQNQYVWDSDALLYLSCWFKREDDNSSKTFV